MEPSGLMWAMFVSSVTGFLFLAGWCWNLHEKYSAIVGTATKVAEMHAMLMGNLEKEGLISHIRRSDERCARIHGKETDGNWPFKEENK